MPKQPNLSPSDDGPSWYTIRVRGQLGAEWADWFGSTLTALPTGDTLLNGELADQSALFGLLRKIRDVGLFLVFLELTTEPLPMTNLANPVSEENDIP